MLFIYRKYGFVLLATVSLFIQGCGGGGNSGPKTVGVSGTVYLDGNPLPDALVTFTSKEFSGAGRTNEEGRYTLGQGAVAGENVVTITKWEGEELIGEEGMDAGQFEAMAAGDPAASGNVMKGPQQIIPTHYSDPEKTDLNYVVPEGGAQDADFRLQSK